MAVLLETSKGDMVVDLLTDELPKSFHKLPQAVQVRAR